MNPEDPRRSLCFALDVPGTREAERLVELLAPHVGVFKVGLELFVREGPALLASIKGCGAERIFLDLKFHDIPRTVQRACRSAARLGVDYLTVHAEALVAEAAGGAGEPGPAGTNGSGGRTGPGKGGGPGREAEAAPRLLAVTVLTSLGADDLPRLGYAPGLAPLDLVLLRAEIAARAGCAGIVCSGREVRAVRERLGPDLLVVTPGVRPSWAVVAGDDQARPLTPREAVEAGSDMVVVGRPIADAEDPAEAARRILDEIAEGLRSRPPARP